MAPETMTRTVEVEWQYDAPYLQGAAAWLIAVGVEGFTVTPREDRRLVDDYFDTDDWRVHRAGYTCRYRRSDDGGELTLKSMAAAKKGIRTRTELTEQVANGHGALLSQSDLPGGEAGSSLRALTGRKQLRRLFTVQTHRRRFRLADVQGEFGEIAIDDTTIPSANGQPACLARVEVEVAEDAVKRARRFVARFVEDCALGHAGASKFGTGLTANGLEPATVPDLGSTDIEGEATVAELAFAVLRRHFSEFLAADPGTRLGEDIEALHDMRVSSRRMRAALRTFEPYLSPALREYRQDLGWVAGALGAVRDLDVQLLNHQAWCTALDTPEAEALTVLERQLRCQREAARTEMLAVLDSPRFEAFVERMTSSLRHGPAPAGRGNEPAREAVPALVTHRYNALRKRGDDITPMSEPSDYHRLRIKAKRLRYLLEFVDDLYPKPVHKLARRVVDLQDLLGEHQDAEVTIADLRALAIERGSDFPPATLLAMGSILEQQRASTAALRAAFPGCYKRLRGKRWAKVTAALEKA